MLKPPYEPPTVSELQEILLADRRPTGHLNEVWPNLYIGNEVAARDKATLHSLGITHIVNAAHGPPTRGPGLCFHVNTGPCFYRDMAVDYYGVEADDAIGFALSPFFYPTALYIRAALAMGGKPVTLGGVLVHCLMGVSRSSTLVLAFLMIAEGLGLREVARAVRAHRDICPNPSFLQQLRSLDTAAAGGETRLYSFMRTSQQRIQCARIMSTMSKSTSQNPYVEVPVDPDKNYTTPGTLDLEQLLWTGTGPPYVHVNKVWPNIYIGDEKTALERATLKEMGITHILNAAEGTLNSVVTGADYYKDVDIHYCGVEADDNPTFNISQHFYSASQFIHSATSHPQNKVLVHCVMGRSRSASLVLAYLMVEQGLTVVDAINHVRQRRCILPNQGFLRQLRALDIVLQERLRRKDAKPVNSIVC